MRASYTNTASLNFDNHGRWNRPRRGEARGRFLDNYGPPDENLYGSSGHMPRPRHNVAMYRYTGGEDTVDSAPRRSVAALREWYSRNFRRHQPADMTDGPPEETEVLKVEKVEFLIEENTHAHTTDEYEITQDEDSLGRRQVRQLVVRRGQPFDIQVTFNRPYDKETDDLKLVFQCGDYPLPSKGTLVEIVLSDKDERNEWGAKVLKTDGNSLTVRIISPPTCYVAKWGMAIDVLKASSDSSDATIKLFRYQHRQPIYILFNPWNSHDSVYADDAEDREEYVMNETGKIYAGTKDQISAKPWNFAQFQGCVLDCALYLLDNSGIAWTARGDPIRMVRKISSICNSPDDDGILVGNWSGKYSGGRSPMAWQGSEGIIDQYYRTKMPVEFGQCWVFSGVTTTLCRTLGIPARSVTNFASAHDCDGTITIDVHWSDKGEPLDDYNVDSVWNFHVWNEVWMARPDLPAGYGGWQVIDATPQETSDGIYCCGPASLVAIKRGDVHLPYDGPFIFAEVNADKVNWCMDFAGHWTKYFQKNVVGKHISTKHRGEIVSGVNNLRDQIDKDRHDVTDLYKFTEGSEQERAAVLRAQACLSHCADKGKIYETGPEDVRFELVEKEEIFIGQGFKVTMKMSNESSHIRQVSVMLSATVIYYTGVPVKTVKVQHYDVTIEGEMCETIVMKVGPEDYMNHLVDHAQLKISCLARVPETQQVFADQDDFRLIKPELLLNAPADVIVGESFEVSVSFTNPLSVTLSGCALSVEGPGLQKPLDLHQSNIPANSTLHTSFRLVPARPSRPGRKRQINVSFNSVQLESIDGCLNVKVHPKQHQ